MSNLILNIVASADRVRNGIHFIKNVAQKIDASEFNEAQIDKFLKDKILNVTFIEDETNSVPIEDEKPSKSEEQSTDVTDATLNNAENDNEASADTDGLVDDTEEAQVETNDAANEEGELTEDQLKTLVDLLTELPDEGKNQDGSPSVKYLRQQSNFEVSKKDIEIALKQINAE